MKNLKVKVITGFREDQFYSIDAEETHKAYYLFLHPDERGIFSNGVALIGKNIQGIEPDYHNTMGWNATHQLDEYDFLEIRDRGIDRALRDVLSNAKEVATLSNTQRNLLEMPLSAATTSLGLKQLVS